MMIRCNTFFISTLLFMAGTALAQEYTGFNSFAWKAADLKKANTAASVEYLTNEEKKIIFFINMARLNPALFASTVFNEYIDKNHKGDLTQNKWVRSCLDELQSTRPMSILYPMKVLHQEAKRHASDMGASGKTGHQSADGRKFEERMEYLYKKFSEIYENCDYGFSDALDIVMDLLIDEDVPDYGHREAILNANLQYIGVSVRPHKNYQYNCVMELAR